MKKKLILLCLISTILSFIIYFYTKSDELTLVSLGDGLSLGMTPYNIEGYSFNDYLQNNLKDNHKLKTYIPYFASENKTIKELIYEIKENKSITINNTIEIQRAINEADILTISIGIDELSNVKITNKIKEEFKNDFTELLSLIKVLNSNKVIVLGIYETPNHDALTTSKINAIIRDITLSNNFIFLDINNILQNPKYYFNDNKYYINYEGHKAIYEKIKELL
ncbi:MAG: hypothetical protein NC483_03650 [Ruminococcus sp.]|nr:hypothetical protein [Ruminococcus sp.]